MSIKLSIFLPQGFAGELAGYTDPVEACEALVRVAQTAEESGYESAWMPDHFHTAPPTQNMTFESWTTLAALARETTRIRLGHLVTGVGYRHPALQAKMASTVDVLTHGRFTLGIGAGWYEPDYRGYGYDFPNASTRLKQLEEAAQVIRAMWTDEEATFHGTHYQIRGAINQPKGIQHPHIPLMIGGGGEKVTLKLVAKYGDACNMLGGPSHMERMYSVLKQHCDAVGRDFESIHRTATTMGVMAETDEEAVAMVADVALAVYPDDVRSYGLIGSPATIRRRLEAYEAAGVQELIVWFNSTDLGVIRQLAETVSLSTSSWQRS